MSRTVNTGYILTLGDLEVDLFSIRKRAFYFRGTSTF